MISCSTCQTTFSKYSSLVRHAKNKHPEKAADIAPSKRWVGSHVCSYCSKGFNSKKNLITHTSIKHNVIIDNIEPKRTLKCPLCTSCPSEKELFTRKEILNHFINWHELGINSSEHIFENVEAFTRWKSSVEKDTVSSFRRNTSWKNKDCFSYTCHRSGFANLKINRLRHLKIQGSKKINGYCPAGMTTKMLKDGSVKVKFVETHVGHSHELKHVNLTGDERKLFASKIAAKIPFVEILNQNREEIRLSVSGLKRKDLLTRKDLSNIEKEFNLQDFSVRHRVDDISTIDSTDEEALSKLEPELLISEGCLSREKVSEMLCGHALTYAAPCDKNTNQLHLKDKIEKARQIMNIIFDTIKSDQEFTAIQEILKSIPPTIDAIRQDEERYISLKAPGPSGNSYSSEDDRSKKSTPKKSLISSTKKSNNNKSILVNCPITDEKQI